MNLFAPYENLAVRCWPHLRRLGVYSVLVTFAVPIVLMMGLPLLSALTGMPLPAAKIAMAVALTGFFGWLVLCCTVWFHPQRGSLRRRPEANFLVRGIHAVLRLWGALMVPLMALAIVACFFLIR